jgi:cytochrome c oxidase subunit 2
MLATTAAYATDYWKMNMHEGVTPLSHDMFDLHMISMTVCILIGIGVYAVLIYSLVKYRKSKGAIAANFHENLKVEIIWTLIPCVILILLAIPATKTLIRLDDARDADVTIKAIGYQWKWQYQYLDEGISFFSNLSTPIAQRENKEKKGEWYLLEVDNPIVVPVHKKIRFLTTSNDVIHSWWVPDLGVKKDAIPGFINEAWARIEKPGIYRGQCAELCGQNHGYMPIVVKAVSQEEYDAWVKKAEKVAAPGTALPDMTMEQLLSKGKNIYQTQCAVCHGMNGEGGVGLPLKGSSVVVGKPIERHIKLVLNGVPGTAMQAFAQQLNEKDLAAVITYERNAFGNNTGDIVQPADVQSVKNGGGVKPTMKSKETAQSGGANNE